MFEKLNKIAFIVVDEASCFYEPDYASAVAIIPPYGSEVEIVKEDGEWVLLKWVGKRAWSVRCHLSNERSEKRYNIIPDSVNHRVRSDHANYRQYVSGVEYGPRGGKFTRTKSGFRRYF
jgi:hypothetical protein